METKKIQKLLHIFKKQRELSLAAVTLVLSTVTVVGIFAFNYVSTLESLNARIATGSQKPVSIEQVNSAVLTAYLLERRPDTAARSKIEPVVTRTEKKVRVKKIVPVKKKQNVREIVIETVPVLPKEDKQPVLVVRDVVEPEPVHTSAPELVDTSGFPVFGNAVHPVTRVPNWGAMRTSSEWNRSYSKMQEDDFVRIPRYNLSVLTQPFSELAVRPIKPENIPALTAKLYYSTRYYGRYDLDSGEFEAAHPGIDLKLASGTPFGSVAGGRVHRVATNTRIGLHIIIEHRIAEETFFSIYGHLENAFVKEGDSITAGQAIGTVGMTGNTTAPHIHLQIDRDNGDRPHIRYQPDVLPSFIEAERFTIHPIAFIRDY